MNLAPSVVLFLFGQMSIFLPWTRKGFNFHRFFSHGVTKITRLNPAIRFCALPPLQRPPLRPRPHQLPRRHKPLNIRAARGTPILGHCASLVGPAVSVRYTVLTEHGEPAGECGPLGRYCLGFGAKRAVLKVFSTTPSAVFVGPSTPCRRTESRPDGRNARQKNHPCCR